MPRQKQCAELGGASKGGDERAEGEDLDVSDEMVRLIDLLSEMPNVGEDADFERIREFPREVGLL
ncbi:MAG: hypothetical protein R3F11_30900 [Verrucomicrobiales bacterium]